MKNIYLVLLVVFVFTFPINAQRRNKNYDVKKIPPWVAGHLPPDSDKIRYKVTYGEGISYQKAQEDATASLITEIGWENGITVSTQTIDELKHTINNDSSSFSQNTKTITIIKQDDYSTSIAKVDEYLEFNESSPGIITYKVWQLYAIDCPWASKINLKYTTKYGFKTAGWKSLIVPGWGQIHKKQFVKGFVFIGIEFGCIVSSIYFQNQYNYNIRKSLETPIQDLQIEYINRSRKKHLYRNISIGAIVAVWVLNILDASLLDGRPKYIESNFDFAFNASPQKDIQLCFTYKF